MAQITFKLPERIVAWPGNRLEPEITTKEMFAKLVCNPPLGQATIVSPGSASVTFSVLLETDPASQKQWQIALWHDLGGPEDEWKAATFKETPADQELVCFSSNLLFGLYLNFSLSFMFSVRLRQIRTGDAFSLWSCQEDRVAKNRLFGLLSSSVPIMMPLGNGREI